MHIIIITYYFFIFLAYRIKLRHSYIIGKWPISELYSKPWYKILKYFFILIYITKDKYI